jgi:hypothetical protein
VGYKKRCLILAADWTPHGCTWTIDDDTLQYWAWTVSNAMLVPTPDNPEALYYYLHECAHIRLEHISRKPRYLEEYEATVWALSLMQEARIPIPHRVRRSTRSYLNERIDLAVAHGAKRIDPRAAAFAHRKELIHE